MSENVKCYYPELADAKPEAQLSIEYCYKSWLVKTVLSIKGRGIRLIGTENGINIYGTTQKAYEKLCAVYTVAQAIYLN